MDNNNITYARQFKFRKDHSTNHSIISLVDKISKALVNGKIVVLVGVYLNTKKDFDTVSHSILR